MIRGYYLLTHPSPHRAACVTAVALLLLSLMPEPLLAVSATGGDITYVGGYVVHTFTNNGTFTVQSGGNVEVLVVAGGGGGGQNGGGGGGGGGVIYTNSYPVTTGQVIPVTVGAGGAPAASVYEVAQNGSNSVFDTLIAVGGGGGASRDGGPGGASGGSGGGGAGATGSPRDQGGSGIAGQGNNGGNGTAPDLGVNAAGGGGGGAGAAGTAASSQQGETAETAYRSLSPAPPSTTAAVVVAARRLTVMSEPAA